MIQEILDHYKKRFKFEKFYDNLSFNMKEWPQYHTKNDNFLMNCNLRYDVKTYFGPIPTQKGDKRVDLPVWLGNPNASSKIAILGLEPRDTDKKGLLNIEREGEFVFGTPFALERDREPYKTAFSSLTLRKDIFAYFSDVVKSYDVSGSGKKHDDSNARRSFWSKAEHDCIFLCEELAILSPTIIVAVGNESYSFLKKHFGGFFRIERMRHPSRGGKKIASQQLEKILCTIDAKSN